MLKNSYKLIIGAIIIIAGVFIFAFAVNNATADIITVDDSGGQNYEKIQNAINASKKGDTIYVYEGIYYENLVVNKTVNLIGNGTENTTIDAEGYGIVVNISADNVNVSKFFISGSGNDWNDAGLKIYTSNNTITNCNLSNNYNSFGVWLYSSNNNTISGCNISNNIRAGIYISYSCNNIITNCNISYNGMDGISPYHSNNNIIISCNILYNDDNGIDLNISCNNNSISNCNISYNNWIGINFFRATKNNISDCNISYNNYNGISLSYSKNNTISYPNISYNDDNGIEISSSNTNTVTNCNIYNNNRRGMYLWNSENNIISNNTFINEGITIFGLTLTHFIHSIENNVVNGKPLLYYKNKDYIDLDGIDVGQIILVNCTNFEIKNINIDNTDTGIYFVFSENNQILSCNISKNKRDCIQFFNSSNNTVSNCVFSNTDYDGINFDESSNYNTISRCKLLNNHYGIVFDESNNNTILNSIISNNDYYAIEFDELSNNNTISGCNISNNKGNGITFDDTCNNNLISSCNISNNYYCIYIHESSFDNTIYHNNFINNTKNAYDKSSNNWDNGIEGNYWDDYTGEDTNGDGIGETPYNIPGGDNQDRYPLIKLIEHNQLPKVNAGKDHTIYEGEEVQLNGTGTDLDGEIVKYEWDFNGDGSYDWESKTTGKTTHSYTEKGMYFAKLRVTDNENATATDICNITVKEKGLVYNVDKDIYYIAIQDAIDDASENNTIRVFAGTFKENVIIDKSLKLIGNGSENTTIDAEGSGIVVKIKADYVEISKFHVTGSGESYWEHDGIKVYTSNNIISYCNISNNNIGMTFDESSNNTILNCIFSDNVEEGIYLSKSDNNTISNNTFKKDGILIWGINLSHFIHSIENNTINDKPLSVVGNPPY